MKVLVQNPITMEFLESDDHWTEEAAEAFAFADSHEAVHYCLLHGLGKMQVVLKFEDGRYDVQLPVGESEHMPEPAGYAKLVA